MQENYSTRSHKRNQGNKITPSYRYTTYKVMPKEREVYGNEEKRTNKRRVYIVRPSYIPFSSSNCRFLSFELLLSDASDFLSAAAALLTCCC
jgi:hypothetical protein